LRCGREKWLGGRVLTIREARPDDWPEIWRFVSQIIAEGETFAYDDGMDETEAKATWVIASPGRTVVAIGKDGAVLGSAHMGPNHGGPGSHVATASFMVDPAVWGEGVGRALCENALDWARAEGYRGMQFNAVAETNARAIALYRSLGFEVMTTIPEGFRHPTEGYVGLCIMYRRL
jgi:L-amino acid N-acyltransferase YncA